MLVELFIACKYTIFFKGIVFFVDIPKVMPLGNCLMPFQGVFCYVLIRPWRCRWAKFVVPLQGVI